MKKLILYGASNYACEVADMVDDINRSQPSPVWELIGFLDDNPAVQGQRPAGIPVLGTGDWLTSNPTSGIYFICCIGNPKAKAKIIPMLEKHNVSFATLIHPSAVISTKATIGKGCIVMAGNIISTSARLEDHIIVNLNCTIGHNTVVSRYCCINPGCNISGDVHIGEGVLAGTNATVLEKLKIGDRAVLGAASLTYQHVPEGASIVGVPGRIMKMTS